MKIIYSIEFPNTVLYAGENIELTAEGATSQSGSFDARTTTENYTIADVESIPEDWIGGAYRFDGEDFEVIDQDLIDASQPQSPVPQVVTMRQARLALLGANKLAAVDTAIDALPEPTKSIARIEWDYSSEVHRNKPLVLTLGPALGLTTQQLDDLFRLAVTL